MQVLGYTLYVLGIAITLAALVWSFVTVYRENQFQALICLLLPMGLPAVMLMRLPATWRPLLAWGVGLTVFVGGLAVMKPGR